MLDSMFISAQSLIIIECCKHVVICNLITVYYVDLVYVKGTFNASVLVITLYQSEIYHQLFNIIRKWQQITTTAFIGYIFLLCIALTV